MSLEENEVQSGLSDDLNTFTVIKDEDGLDNIDEYTPPDDNREPVDNTSEDGFFDINTVPEDQREAVTATYGKMKTAFDEKMSGVNATQQQQTATINALVEKLKGVQSQGQPATKPDVPTEREMQFKFEKGDYYKPAFDEVADLVSGLTNTLDGLKNGYMQDKQAYLETNVKSFFARNKVSPQVLGKMDEIAVEFGKDNEGNFIAHRNLPRLLKMAKSDLGVVDKPTPRPNPRNQVESSTKKRGTVQRKPANSMQEAWKQAESMLKE